MRVRDLTKLSYEDAKNLLGDKEEYELCNHTYLWRYLGRIVVRFYFTNIITIYPDDTYELCAGNFMTPSTTYRMRKIAGVDITRRDGKWYICGTEFFDGMIVDKEGNLV